MAESEPSEQVRSTFSIPGMDCPSEEQLVRMQLADSSEVSRLEFDLSARRLVVYHDGSAETIENLLSDLGLGSELIDQSREDAAVGIGQLATDDGSKHPLWFAFAINASLFVAEFVAGLLAGSMGLVADSLDMLADAIVYGLSLSAVGRDTKAKKRVAGKSGFFQMSLAILGLVEVGRRFFMAGETPDWPTMIVMSLVALAGNVVTLFILSKANREEAHMQASWIFTSNDIKVNLLVIVSGGLVLLLGSAIPDLVAGALIFLIVARGAIQILRLSS